MSVDSKLLSLQVEKTNFIVAIMYSRLFNLLCDKADDVYNGRLPVHVIIAANIHSALFSIAAYTVILCFSLFKTGSLSLSIFGSH